MRASLERGQLAGNYRNGYADPPDTRFPASRENKGAATPLPSLNSLALRAVCSADSTRRRYAAESAPGRSAPGKRQR